MLPAEMMPAPLQVTTLPATNVARGADGDDAGATTWANDKRGLSPSMVIVRNTSPTTAQRADQRPTRTMNLRARPSSRTLQLRQTPPIPPGLRSAFRLNAATARPDGWRRPTTRSCCRRTRRRPTTRVAAARTHATLL